MRKSVRSILKGVVFFLPFLIATVGFHTQLHDGLFNAMYRAARLYIMELDCDYSEVTPLIEIARWTAPLMSAAAVATLLNHLFGLLRFWSLARRDDAVAIHGDSDYTAFMRESFGAAAIPGDVPISLRAPNQVLSFREDRDMLAYLSANRDALLRDGHRVYLCAEQLERSNFRNRSLILCNFPELCARGYWRSYPLRLDPLEECIVIIGFQNYGQQMLTQGLLTNVLAVNSRICYHVFGDSAEYRSQHTQLAQAVDVDPETPVRDSVYFHGEPWHACPELLSRADRIILVNDEAEQNLEILNKLEKYYQPSKIYVKVSSTAILDDLWSGAVSFGTAKSLCTRESILNEQTMLDAVRIHAGYFRSYACPERNECSGKACRDCDLFREDWARQSNFIRYSNVAQADHIPVKLRILLGEDASENAGARAEQIFDGLSEDKRLELAELEHIRWARYHFMNNWAYAPVRDNARRRHPLLVPFRELSDEDQRKDEAVWRNAFALSAGTVH